MNDKIRLVCKEKSGKNLAIFLDKSYNYNEFL